MNKPAKTLAVVVTTLLLLALVGVLLLGQLDRLIKHGVEETGPQLTGTPVSLARADVSVFSGDGALTGLQIRNPEGFATPYAFDLSAISLALDLKSLGQDVIIIREIHIDGAKLVTELAANGQNNLKIIRDHARRMVDDAGRGSETADTSTTPAPRFVIKSFKFTNAQLQAVAPALGLDKTLTLPDIALVDIGAKSNGATASEAAEQVLGPVINAAIQQARTEFLGGQAEQLKQKISDKLLELFN